eukprot:8499545-Karenia_brevis.AAC.1
MAALDSATANQMNNLVGETVPEAEVEDLSNAVSKLRACVGKSPIPKVAVVRRRLSLLNMSAEPGPSGLRNSHLALLKKVANG